MLFGTTMLVVNEYSKIFKLRFYFVMHNDNNAIDSTLLFYAPHDRPCHDVVGSLVVGSPHSWIVAKRCVRVLLGGAENAGVENAGVEKAGVDSRGGKCRSGKCRSDNLWKVVRIENSKIPVVYAQTVCERCSWTATWCTYPGSVRTHGSSSLAVHAQCSH